MKVKDFAEHYMEPRCYGQGFAVAASVAIPAGVSIAAKKLRPSLDIGYGNFPGRVGIELEAENGASTYHYWRLAPLWTLKEDGSLRNTGVEFVSPALYTSDLADAIAILYAGIQKYGSALEYTERTSVHVHLECLDMSIPQLQNLILLYLVSESSLFQFASPGRRDTNIFCTPLSRTNFYGLHSFFAAKTDRELQDGMHEVYHSIQKYSALNFLHLMDYGTLEFRHLRGTGDPALMASWVKILTKLAEAACNLSPETVRAHILQLNTTSAYAHFNEIVFGDCAPLLQSPMYKSFMSEGITLAKEILAGRDVIKTIGLSEKGGVASYIRAEEKKQQSDKLTKKLRERHSRREITLSSGKKVWIDIEVLGYVCGIHKSVLMSCTLEDVRHLYTVKHVQYARAILEKSELGQKD